MSAHASRRFSLSLEVPKLLMLTASYVPYVVFSQAKIMGNDRFVVFGIGIYLMLALTLRNLVGWKRRMPAWAKWLWFSLDFLLWWYSQVLTHWDTGTLYAGLMLVADGAMLGWERWRGLVPFGLTSLFTVLGPLMIGMPVPFTKWVIYCVQLIPGYLLIYGFIYLAGRMSEEREAADRARKEAELANAQLREYARQVEDLAVLRERNRVAREVHDTVAHGFTGMIMQLEAVTRMLTKHPDKVEQALLQIQDQARQSLAEVRRSVHALRPLQMEERKGIAALQQLVEGFSTTTGVAVDLAVSGTARELPTGHDLCLYRTVQEGLTNAFRHGRATRATVQITFSPDAVVANVVDNGRSSAGGDKPGLGLVGVRERADVLGGRVEAGPAPGGGFCLTLTLPLTEPGGVATA